MSEISQNQNKRIKKLIEVSELTIKTGNARSFILENREFINKVIPSDFIFLFDELIRLGYTMDELKTASNKILNIFHIPIQEYPTFLPEKDSFLWLLSENNRVMEKMLSQISPVFKQLNKEPENQELVKTVLYLFKELQKFEAYYTIKENVLFPAIERQWPNYRCLQIMWSFHDDIRRKIKGIIQTLSELPIDLKTLNPLVGDVFFNMTTIKFREEKIVFPLMLSTFPEEQLHKLLEESAALGFPYVQPENLEVKPTMSGYDNGLVDLGTGQMSIEQLILLFNHLPIDITFVDETDTVRFFSTPKKRIFPRTNAIIGRKVQNCHPPESMHVVSLIIESFKNGSKDKADFWIKMHETFILIQYFAVRDKSQQYKGVIEVTQEITEIQAISGEKRILDWQ